jgi:hypothetical protein
VGPRGDSFRTVPSLECRKIEAVLGEQSHGFAIAVEHVAL